MSAPFLRVVLLAASLAPAGYGQFQLFVVNGSAEQPAPAVYNLGAVYPNQAASAHFRLRNTSSAAATLTVLAVAGAGFTLNGPALPVPAQPAGGGGFHRDFSRAGRRFLQRRAAVAKEFRFCCSPLCCRG